MNVFVLCTGRCGSTTFARACSHIRNFSAAHESRTGRLGDDRLRYAPQHIEIDNRLAWLLGRLEAAYGPKAFYVHLQRNRSEVAASFARRANRGIMRAYGGDGILLGLSSDTDALELAFDYIDTVTANITAFLRDKPHRLAFPLEQARTVFPEFWARIGAEGDLGAALDEFGVRHNASSVSAPAPGPG